MSPLPQKSLVREQWLSQGTPPLNPYSCSLSNRRMTLDKGGGGWPKINNRWGLRVGRGNYSRQDRWQGHPPTQSLPLWALVSFL